MTKEEILSRYFGYSEFRTGQSALIDNIIRGRDALGIMPTGAGKSVCFQVPAMLFSGVTIVVSPLISLMKDQVEALITAGIPAAYINSSLTAAQSEKAIQNAKSGKYKIIYAAPERLDVEEFISFACDANISLIAVDEAHCVSQWGQDFRPSYLKINDFVDKLPKRPIIAAFTATATEAVKDDIIKILRLKEPFCITTGFDRKNLYFGVLKPADKLKTLIGYLAENNDKSGIVYCSTRKTVTQVCDELKSEGYMATRYHAGLSEKERSRNQEDFLYDRATVMVATNAFGMGIDKSNVNFVIHYNMPKNIEGYYQEAGRAGRDGTPAECILYYSGQDVVTNQFLIERSSEQSELEGEEALLVKQREYERLKVMTFYCHTTDCLRGYILKYFGETADSFCDNCSNCKANFESADILTESKKILSCIVRTGQSYGVKTVIDTLRGSRNEKILRLGFDKLSTYGIMKDTTENKIREIINFLVLNDYIMLTSSEYPTAHLTEKGNKLLHSQNPLYMKLKKPEKVKTANVKSGKSAAKAAIKFGGDFNNDLFLALKQIRLDLSSRAGVPAFVIFSDATLVDMCRKMPENEEQMLEVSGVGETKLARYGKDFLDAINSASESAEESLEPIKTKAELFEYVKNEFKPEGEILVSELADKITSLLLTKSDCKISPVKLTSFCEEKGLLEVIEIDGKNAKVPTDKGLLYGINTIEAVNKKGEKYMRNMYNEKIQQYIVDSLLEIIGE